MARLRDILTREVVTVSREAALHDVSNPFFPEHITGSEHITGAPVVAGETVAGETVAGETVAGVASTVALMRVVAEVGSGR